MAGEAGILDRHGRGCVSSPLSSPLPASHCREISCAVAWAQFWENGGPGRVRIGEVFRSRRLPNPACPPSTCPASFAHGHGSASRNSGNGEEQQTGPLPCQGGPGIEADGDERIARFRASHRKGRIQNPDLAHDQNLPCCPAVGLLRTLASCACRANAVNMRPRRVYIPAPRCLQTGGRARPFTERNPCVYTPKPIAGRFSQKFALPAAGVYTRPAR